MDCNDLKSYTVLYVEDEDTVREIIGRSLRRACKEVHLAANGAEGIELFEKHHCDLVVTDIEMPVMNGIEMIRRIKEIDSDRPCVVVTAYKDESHRSELAEVTIYKPVDLQELKEAMVRACKKHTI